MCLPPLVLVADGDPAVRNSIKFLLELESLTVDLCASGRELVAHPALARARCCVVDHHLDDGDGLAVSATLMGLGLTTPLVLTADATTGRLRRAVREGQVHVVLEKPLLGGELVSAVLEAVGDHRGHP